MEIEGVNLIHEVNKSIVDLFNKNQQLKREKEKQIKELENLIKELSNRLETLKNI